MRVEFFFPICKVELVNKKIGDQLAAHFGGWTRCTSQGAWLHEDSVQEELVYHYTVLTNYGPVEANSWISLLFFPSIARLYSEAGEEQVEFMFAIDSSPVLARV